MRALDMSILRKAAMTALFALALASCNGSEVEDGEPPVGEPIAHVAPPEGQLWQDVAAVTPEGGVVIGNPNAELKLVEYASHTCHVCADFSKQGSAAMNEYVNTGVISYEIRNLIRDPVDLTIAIIARCGDASLFHPLADAAWGEFDPLMAQIQSRADAIGRAVEGNEDKRFQAIAESSGVLEFFAARGVSTEQAMTCLADTDGAQQLADRSEEQSDAENITGTPTFFLNGRRLNATSWRAVEPILQNAGARDQ
jgi:protein-disulfide isomerase